jgi:hypothetical protein
MVLPSTVRDLVAGPGLRFEDRGLLRCVACPSRCTFTWFWVASRGRPGARAELPLGVSEPYAIKKPATNDHFWRLAPCGRAGIATSTFAVEC